MPRGRVDGAAILDIRTGRELQKRASRWRRLRSAAEADIHVKAGICVGKADNAADQPSGATVRIFVELTRLRKVKDEVRGDVTHPDSLVATRRLVRVAEGRVTDRAED